MPNKGKSSSSSKRVNRKVRKTLRRAQPKFGFTQENAHGEFNSAKGIGPYGVVGPQPPHGFEVGGFEFDDPFEDVMSMSTMSFRPTYHGGREEQLTIDYTQGPGLVFDPIARREYDFAGNRLSDIGRAVHDLDELQARVDMLDERERRNNFLRELPSEQITGDLLRRIAPGILADENEIREYPSGITASSEIADTFVYQPSLPGAESMDLALPTSETNTFGSNVEMFRLPAQPTFTGVRLLRDRNPASHLGGVSLEGGMDSRAPPLMVRQPEALGYQRARVLPEQLSRPYTVPPQNMFASQEYRAPMGPVYLDRENTQTLGYQLPNAPRAFELNPNSNPPPPPTIKGTILRANRPKRVAGGDQSKLKGRYTLQDQEKVVVRLPRKTRNVSESNLVAHLKATKEEERRERERNQPIRLPRRREGSAGRTSESALATYLAPAIAESNTYRRPPPTTNGPFSMGYQSLEYLDDEEPLPRAGTKRTIKQKKDVKRLRTMKVNNKRIRET